MIEAITTANKAAFLLKGSTFTLTVLQLLTVDTQAFCRQIADTVKKAPRFFQHTPIIIDLQKISNQSQVIDFNTIIQQLRQHSIIPVGVIGGNEEQLMQSRSAGLAILPHSKIEAADEAIATTPVKQKTASTPPQKQHVPAMLIKQPVRSGQQIYARKCDLIVLASVSPGAELLSDGNIHIYGALRGRALAGVTGDKTARIFCQELEAELVSVAGFYWVNEDLKLPTEHHGLQIYLEDERLKMSSLAH